MRLLFDANISRKLVSGVADLFPDSSHVALLGLERADDDVVWAYAAEHDYLIVSKDEDFHQLALLMGPPPKLVWARLGNCSTAHIQRALRDERTAIEEFAADDAASFMVLR